MKLQLGIISRDLVGSDRPLLVDALLRAGFEVVDQAAVSLHVCPASEFVPTGNVDVLWCDASAVLTRAELRRVAAANVLVATSRYTQEVVQNQARQRSDTVAIAGVGYDDLTFHGEGRCSDSPTAAGPRVLWEAAPGRDPRAGLLQLAEAWSATLADNPTATLTLLLPDDGESRVESSGKVKIYRGELSNHLRAHLYRESHAMVVTSSHATPGRTQLEAAACGLPVIALGWRPDLGFFTDATCEAMAFDGDWASDRAEMLADQSDLRRALAHLTARYPRLHRKAVRAKWWAANDWTWPDVVERVAPYISARVRRARGFRVAA